MFRALQFFVVVSIVGMGPLVTWLVWPLPSAKFDWRELTQTFAEQDDCVAVMHMMFEGSVVDPLGMSVVLETFQQDEICPEYLDPSSPINVLEPLEVSRSAYEFIALEPGPSWPARAGEAFSLWWDMRGFRFAAGMGVTGSPDAVLAFRCRLAFGDDVELLYYSARLTLSDGYTEPMYLPEWERRRDACNTLVAQQVEDLGGDLTPDSPSFDGSPLDRLRSQYETRLQYPY